MTFIEHQLFAGALLSTLHLSTPLTLTAVLGGRCVYHPCVRVLLAGAYELMCTCLCAVCVCVCVCNESWSVFPLSTEKLSS